jgi:hypothetical protein
MLLNLGSYLSDGKYLLLVTGGIILVLECWIVLEAVAAIRRLRSRASVMS